MEKDAKIYIAGHQGLLGSALVRTLELCGYNNLLVRTRSELDLTEGSSVKKFFEKEGPEFVFLAAAKVGGIWANSTYPAEFIYQNLRIQTEVLHSAYEAGVRRLIFFGSNCTYPVNCHQPMREEDLMSGFLEPTSEAYAIAKLAGMKMCSAYGRQYGSRFFSIIPPTLYGPNDDFNLQTSHVITGLIGRIHNAKLEQSRSVEIWGTGTQRREFLYVDDMADVCLFLMNLDDDKLCEILEKTNWVCNVGAGEDFSILELASEIKAVVGFQGDFKANPCRPEGAAAKLLDSQRIHQLGWVPKTSLREGIELTYKWFLSTKPI